MSPHHHIEGTGARPARRHGTLFALGLLVLAGSLLQGCREEEQGRTLLFDKGNYIGKQADDKLDPSAIEALAKRAGKQG